MEPGGCRWDAGIKRRTELPASPSSPIGQRGGRQHLTTHVATAALLVARVMTSTPPPYTRGARTMMVVMMTRAITGQRSSHTNVDKLRLGSGRERERSPRRGHIHGNHRDGRCRAIPEGLAPLVSAPVAGPDYFAPLSRHRRKSGQWPIGHFKSYSPPTPTIFGKPYMRSSAKLHLSPPQCLSHPLSMKHGGNGCTKPRTTSRPC